MERSLCILNEEGDKKITWRPEHDADMEEIIARKMKAGVRFYTIPQPRKPGQKGRLPGAKQLKDPAKAHEHRALSIKDEDFSRFVLEGKGEVVEMDLPASPIEGRPANDPGEVAKGHSIGVKQRKAG